MRFTRYYNSSLAKTIAGTLGSGWSNTYDRLILGPQILDPAANNYASATRPDGNVYHFNLVNGQWLPDADVSDRLVQLPNNSGLLYLTAEDEVETYSASGRLISLKDRAGRTQTLVYDANGRLVAVRDGYGRSLEFTYDAQGRISTMTEPAQGVFTYMYSSENDLVSVRYPDGGTRAYVYNERINTNGGVRLDIMIFDRMTHAAQATYPSVRWALSRHPAW